MLSIQIFTFNEFSENTIVAREGKHCVIIDPGCYLPVEIRELTGYIEQNRLEPVSVWNTHCHIDHILGVQAIKEHYGIPFLIGRKEEPVLKSAGVFSSFYGYHGFKPPEPDGFFEDGQELNFGKSGWEVIDVPGHSPGHIALYNRQDGLCISGDVLFYRSIGRSDLPGGDQQTLLRSIRKRLFTLPEHTRIFPGHGRETTIGEEKKYNPFCGGFEEA